MFDNFFSTSRASAISQIKHAGYASIDRLPDCVYFLQCTSKAMHSLSFHSQMRNRAVIKVATDCSGMEAPLTALNNLNLGKFTEKMFSSDIDRNCRITIHSNFPGGESYSDLLSRDNNHAPACDLYVVGFPCQPFSTAGVQKGFEDSRGQVHVGIIDYLEKKRPKAFVFENVYGLLIMQGGEVLRTILKMIDDMKSYNIHHKLMNTKAHGIPQNRDRLYIVGLHFLVFQCLKKLYSNIFKYMFHNFSTPHHSSVNYGGSQTYHIILNFGSHHVPPHPTISHHTPQRGTMVNLQILPNLNGPPPSSSHPFPTPPPTNICHGQIFVIIWYNVEIR